MRDVTIFMHSGDHSGMPHAATGPRLRPVFEREAVLCIAADEE